jgi:hypothetical protein
VQPARVGVLGAGEGSGKGFFVSASHTWQESEVVWPRAKVGRGGAAARPQQQGWGPGGGSAGHTWQEPEAGVLGAHQRPQLGTQDLLVVLLVLDLEHVVPLAGLSPAGELRPGRHRGLVAGGAEVGGNAGGLYDALDAGHHAPPAGLALQLTLDILVAGSATQIFLQGSAARTYFCISSLCFESSGSASSDF